jgi:hypothetical protein
LRTKQAHKEATSMFEREKKKRRGTDSSKKVRQKLQRLSMLSMGLQLVAEQFTAIAEMD